MTIPVDNSLIDNFSQCSTPTQMADALFEFMQRKGNSFYDEAVTQLEHALQAALLARQNKASPSQVVAALLHDIGHFLMDEEDQQSDFLQEDWLHEEVGADQLTPYFDQSVIEPIRLHVPAKRYLCTVDPEYYQGLSRASKRSYELQGGPLSEREKSAFESHPHYQSAVLLRRWDDGAKITGFTTPRLSDFREEVEACIKTP
ncbi:MAG: HD domain-containing protein [Planctomycetota bacterium]|nr:HD domain-containing protein [Planctomycetota bacterium]